MPGSSHSLISIAFEKGHNDFVDPVLLSILLLPDVQRHSWAELLAFLMNLRVATGKRPPAHFFCVGKASLTFHYGSAMTEQFLHVAAKSILTLVRVRALASLILDVHPACNKKIGKMSKDTEVFSMCKLFSRSAKFFLNWLQLKKSNLI